MEKEYITVSQLNKYINSKLKKDVKLKNILVKGEISNCKTYSSGHMYFTLKDKNSEIPCVMYKNYQSFVKFKPEDGMSVIAKGKVEVYEKQGKYQLYVHRLTEYGIGDLYIAFEQLKKKLETEGLFDEEHKKEIPEFPKRIGVVSSRSGSVIKDIKTTVQRRWKSSEIILFPTLVQGDMAAPQIVKQIKRSQNYDLDVLIIARGGGSIEDLWPFNEEIVARAIYDCKIPVISAIGHETDYTISDFVADLRAPTPTAAGELAVPNSEDVKKIIKQLNLRANNCITNKIRTDKNKLEAIKRKQVLKNPESIYQYDGMTLDNLVARLTYSSKSMITQNKNRFNAIKSAPALKNPQTIPEKKENDLERLINKLTYSSQNIITKNENRLYNLKNSSALKNPQTIPEKKENDLERLMTRLTYSSQNIITKQEHRFTIIKNSKILKDPTLIIKKKEDRLQKDLGKLEILNPIYTLKRGFTRTYHDGKIVSSVKDIKKDDELEIEFKDGKINTKVI